MIGLDFWSTSSRPCVVRQQHDVIEFFDDDDDEDEKTREKREETKLT